MSLKILGGVARGFLLTTPRSLDTRPTSVLVRRKIFDWRQHLDGHCFIDLCAGSGAMGFEALSRGADEAYFIDSGRPAHAVLKENKEKFSKAFAACGPSHISSMDAVKWVEQQMSFELLQNESTILFFDPPYEDHKLYLKVLNVLKDRKYQGEVWIEADNLKGQNRQELLTYLELTKIVEQGDHFVLIGKLV